MVEGALTQSSPLYGRRTGQWKLESLKSYQIQEFYKGIDIERSIEFYSVLGGIPLYLDLDDFQFINNELHRA
jgi:hypothetical protein